MISYISSWAEQVIVSVIIGTILEMILPNGNMKKYIKTLIGVYILYTIVSPAISLAMGKDFKLDYSDYEKYFNTSQEYENITIASVEDTYKTEIRNQMKKDIEELGLLVNNITFDINLETGIITNVNLSINKGKSNKSSISINKIEIGNGENTLTFQEIEKVKEILNTNYGIKYEEIKVNSI